MAFRCPVCQAWVKRAPVVMEVNVDEIFMCYCMFVWLRRDTERPESSSDWQTIRMEEQERMRAEARDQQS